MSTDRELLELAAKAAGAKRTDYSDRTPDHWIIKHSDRISREWRPLTDDGDALRLAVQLGIEISFINGDTHANDACEGGPDKLANTRNAIVRAAAAIGESMP